jgi:hypothetical protein
MPNESTPATALRACEKCEIAINQVGELSTFNGVCASCKDRRCRMCCTCYVCTGCTDAARGRVTASGPARVTHSRESHPRCNLCKSCISVPERSYTGSCGCRVCVGCSSRRAAHTFCREPNCNRSRDCCGCACTRGWMFLSQPSIKFHSTTFRNLKSKRYLSLEVEVAQLGSGKKFMEAINRWKCAIVSDGSVGDGFEINTAPAAGDSFVQLITELGDAMAQQGGTVDQRCGLHCHVDARDFNFYEARRLGLLWQRIEPALYRLVHPARRHSSYCVPCGAKYGPILEQGKLPKQAKEKYFEATYNKKPSKELNRATLRGNKYGGNRYNSLNMHSWMFRGTFENRMHHGTVDTKKMLNWGMLNAAILDWAATRSDADLYKLWRSPSPTVLEPSINESVAILWAVIENDGLRKYWQDRYHKLEKYHLNQSHSPVDP